MKGEVKSRVSFYDLIGVIADIQTSFTENFKLFEKSTNWTIRDARLALLFTCADLMAHARLSIGLIGFAKSNGLKEKEWWGKWAMYDIRHSFHRIPDFDIFVEDKVRQYVNRVQEQFVLAVFVYTEAFLRQLSRQLGIKADKFWEIKQNLLIKHLKFSEKQIEPLTIYQHLRNSLHNKGLHWSEKNSALTFSINGYPFEFKHGKAVKVSWESIRELLVSVSNLLVEIIQKPEVKNLATVEDTNTIILQDKE